MLVFSDADNTTKDTDLAFWGEAWINDAPIGIFAIAGAAADIIKRQTPPTRGKGKFRLKGGQGSGHYGHRGRPGIVGGGLPDNAASIAPPIYGITQGSQLDQDIQNGVYDIPANIKKRRFQMQTEHPEAEAYAEDVWLGIREEMKAQGIPEEKIKQIEFVLYRFMGSTDSMEAKTVIGALEKSMGKSDEEVRAIITEEMHSRMTDTGIAYLAMGEFVRTGGDPFSDEGLALFRNTEVYTGDYTNEDYRNPEYWYRNNIIERTQQMKEYAEHFERVVRQAQDPQIAHGIAIVSDASKKLYARNAESETLYRGIYDFMRVRGRGSRAHQVEEDEGYYPVKWIEEQFHRYETDPEHPWTNREVIVGTTATLDSDRLVCWAPSKQIARTFAAGGGLRGENIGRKAILSSTRYSNNVAFYWPAIYKNLGSSIDTKEVWVYNPNGKMTINIDEFTRV